MMRFAVLGSGSSGNSMVVQAPDGRTLLIDAGLSARQLTHRLAHLGLAPDQLHGILLTHEHGDHTRGLSVFCRQQPIPLLATEDTGRLLQEDHGLSGPWHLFSNCHRFEWEGFEIETFPISHDAVDPVGYVIGLGSLRLGIATDLGRITAPVHRALAPCHGLILEANYDDELLALDQKRPLRTKQRIASAHGHLSNAQALSFLAELQSDVLQHLVFAHLSADCNAAERLAPARQHLPAQARWCCAPADQPSEWFTLKHPSPTPPTSPPHQIQLSLSL